MRYIFLISLVVLTACGKNEFLLNFNLSSDITENYDVTYYATDTKGGITVQAVASVREGKCELKGFTKRPTLLYLSKRASSIPLVIYAEKGNKIDITGDNKDYMEWNVNGNEINETITRWRLQNKDILKESKPDSINMAVRNYVLENAGNPISTILMLSYYNREIDERGFNELMGSLTGDAKDNNWLSIMGRADQIDHSYSYPARFENMILRSYDKKTDTLYADKKNPVLLFFWQTGYKDRKVIIDSIKTLEKDYPDSVRIIADICMDPDSIGWKNAMKKDSLYKEMKRFWSPMGFNDPTMKKLKVKGLPYFIIFNKEGEQAYRGTDIQKAIEEYRRLQSIEDTTEKTK